MTSTNTKTKSDFILPDLDNIYLAAERLQGVAVHTPLMHNLNLSERYGANIYLKREDLQVVRSYKIRGAYNKMATLSKEQLEKGVVCASAGNHAQGLAYACRKLEVNGNNLYAYDNSCSKNQTSRNVWERVCKNRTRGRHLR